MHAIDIQRQNLEVGKQNKTCNISSDICISEEADDVYVQCLGRAYVMSISADFVNFAAAYSCWQAIGYRHFAHE